MRFREWRIENGEWIIENGELRMENGEWRIGKEVVILNVVRNLFYAILSLAKNLKGFREVGERFE